MLAYACRCLLFTPMTTRSKKLLASDTASSSSSSAVISVGPQTIKYHTLYLSSGYFPDNLIGKKESAGFVCKLPHKFHFDQSTAYECAVVEASILSLRCNVFEAVIWYRPPGGGETFEHRISDGLYSDFQEVLDQLNNFFPSNEVSFSFSTENSEEVEIRIPEGGHLKLSNFFFRCFHLPCDGEFIVLTGGVRKNKLQFNSYWAFDVLFLEAPNWIETTIVSEGDRPILASFTPAAPPSNLFLVYKPTVVSFKEVKLSQVDNFYFEIRNWKGQPVRFMKRMCYLHLIIRARH